MGRPKAFDRDLAVKTVMNEIWKSGYAACSVKAISEKLGITRSSFYNTFGSREELFFEVLNIYFKQSPDRALSNIEGKGRVLRDVCCVFNEVCKARSSDPQARGCLVVNSLIELVGTDDKIGRSLENAIQTSVERFENILNMAAESGEIAKVDIHTKALALQNLLIGINVLSKVIHRYDELWASTRHTLIGLELYDKQCDEIL